MNRLQALQYVRNTAGNGTIASFADDWSPVGEMEWEAMTREGLVEANAESHIFLTEAGAAKLAELENEPG